MISSQKTCVDKNTNRNKQIYKGVKDEQFYNILELIEGRTTFPATEYSFKLLNPFFFFIAAITKNTCKIYNDALIIVITTKYYIVCTGTVKFVLLSLRHNLHSH